MFCLSPFCCVCLRNKEELFNLNNVDSDLIRLWDKLLYCMPEIDDINEDIPLFICRECRCHLRVAYTFRKKFVTNYPYVDNYIRQLTYVDGLLLAVEDVEVTEHADLCVTLVDFAKRYQHSSSIIKIETNGDESNSIEIQSEHNDFNRENQSTELTENPNKPENLGSNWEILTSNIENPTKRRKLDDDTSIVTEIIDIQDEDSASNSVDVKDDTISLEEINDHNHNDLDGIYSQTEVQKASEEEQAVISDMSVEVSTLLTLQVGQNVDIHDQNNLLEEANKDINSAQSSSMEPEESETNTEDRTIPANTLNQQQSSQNEHLQVICDHIPTSSNKNKEENACSRKKSTGKQPLNTLVHPGKAIRNQQAYSVKQTEVTQPADIEGIRPADSVTNALFKSIRNKTCADVDDDDVSSIPSVATSMYESDVIEDGIELDLSENSAEYISVSVSYSDISSPNNTADMNYALHDVNSEIHQLSSESRCAEPSRATLVHIKHRVSDVEDNYSNETVLYQDAIRPNTTDSVTSPAMTNFSFIKAYLESTDGNMSTNTKTGSKNCQTEQLTTDANTNATDECNQQNQGVSNNNQITSNSGQDKSVSAECKKTVYTSIRKKIPRMIDLNGSIRKNATSTFEHFTTGNNKYSLTSHTQQMYRLVNCQTRNSTNVQEAIKNISRDTTNVQDSEDTTSTNVQQETHLDFRDTTSDSSNIPARSTSVVYKCTVCDATFKYQSLLECHVQEKHTREQELLPGIIVQDEQLIRNSRLATYRIPHVYKTRSIGPGADSVESVALAKDTTPRRISVNESVEAAGVNKHKVGVDVATNTVNVICIKDKLSASMNTKDLLHKQHSISAAAAQQTSNQVTIGAQFKPHKSSETKHNQCKNYVVGKIKSQKKHHHSSASSRSTKKRNRTGTMIDKATGTIDFAENGTGIYAFTDAMEENMYRIRTDENNNHTDQSKRQPVDKVAMKVTNKLKPVEKLHKQPDIVHYYQTTQHLSVDKHGTKSCKKHKAKANSRSVEKVDKSTETGDLIVPRLLQPSINNVVNETVSAEPETNISVIKGSTKCSLCASTFPDLNSLREHLIIQHKTYKKFQCTLCEKYFRQRCRLLYHMVNSHATAQLHVCGLCDKNFSCKATLNRHMRIHCGDKPYKCTVCDKAFRYKESVKTHMVLHTGVKAYRCPYCQRTFSFRGNMLQHVQTHTRDKRYPCPMCDKDFCTNTVMKQHMRTHTGERPYKCPTCARAFTVRQTMVQHMSVHTDAKPHPCTMCTARFKQKSHLRRHMFVHTDDKPYRCTVCDKTFRLKTELNKHSAIHDITRQPYTCDICNVGYARNDQLYAHNFNVHYKKDINLVTLSKDK